MSKMPHLQSSKSFNAAPGINTRTKQITMTTGDISLYSPKTVFKEIIKAHQLPTAYDTIKVRP